MKSYAKNKNFGLVLCLIAILIVSIAICFVTSIGNEVSYDDFNVQTEFNVVDSLPDGNGKRVKVILLNGQSNATGVAHVSYLKEQSSLVDLKNYENGFPNVYINYFCDTGRNTSNGKFVNVKVGQGVNSDYFGPELGLAKNLSAESPNETFIILKYTLSGSNLHTQWRAPSSRGKTGKLYNAFINFTRVNMEYLRSKNYDAEIVAMCWMQGESDAFDIEIAKDYKDNLEDLIHDAREDLSPYVKNDSMYFIDAGISDSPLWTHYKTVNNAKREVSTQNTKNIYLDTVSVGLSYLNEPFEAPDLAHYDSDGMLLLGELFAESILLIP